MQIQADYETDITLAVFRTIAQLEAAVQQLVHAGLHPDGLDTHDLAPGRYELVDTSPSEEVGGAVRGVGIGLPAGAAVGGVAASLFGASPEILAAAASAGAVCGGLLGAFEGAVLRTRFDDDAATTHLVPIGETHRVLVLHTTGADRTTTRVRQVLVSGGAVGFLEPSLFEQTRT